MINQPHNQEMRTPRLVATNSHRARVLYAEICREGGTVNLSNMRPSLGVRGTRKVEFCSEHAKHGMGPLRKKKCSNQGLHVLA